MDVNKILEDFKIIKMKTINAGYDYGFKVWDDIEQALTELKAIKEVKPSEAINYLDQFINEMTRCLENPKQYAKNYDKEIFYKYKHTLETTIKQALLKQLSGSQYTNFYIDEAVNPDEVMKAVEDIYRNGVFLDLNGQPRKYSWETNKSFNEQITLVKQYILKAQEQEKVLEIIKELISKHCKNELIDGGTYYQIRIKVMGSGYTFGMSITKEEFETLKQYFEKNIQNQ